MTRREPKRRLIKRRGLILCEGETEVIYFRLLKDREEVKRGYADIDIEIYQPTNYSPLGLVTEAKEKFTVRKGKPDEVNFVWCVFDKDKHDGLPGAFAEARKSGVHIAFSAVCFEFWIYLHFNNKERRHTECDSMESEVRKEYSDYLKANRNSIKHVLSKIEIARKNAKLIINNQESDTRPIYERSAYTDVHKLVDFLLGESKS